MLARIRKAEENDKGFTLIELLVVVIIIGILSAIAIPTFLKQREKAWDKALNSDLRNNATKMEEYMDDFGGYPATAPTGTYAFKTSETNEDTAVVAVGPNGYCLSVTSTKDFADNVKYFLSSNGKPSTTACSSTDVA